MPGTDRGNPDGGRRDDRRATLLRYVAFQVAGALGLLTALWVLHVLFGLAWWVIALVLALSILKDIVLYPKLREAYRPHAGLTGGETLVGRRGRATTQIDPEGWVRIGHEVWRARLMDGAAPVRRDGPVVVRAVDGLTLVVTGEPEGAPQDD
ncbi:MAG: hypothetical protein D6738_14845 [Acidobacteria bacterium]|nr:MAG: hypothetical protein D6738_14845 [Acidobacteriota bacterium]